MKILVLGISGMLGKDIFRILNTNFGSVYGTLRNFDSEVEKYIGYEKEKIFTGINIENIESLINTINLVKPDIVINCIGLIKQIKKNLPEYLAINTVFTHNLYILSKKYNFKIIHFSTDCVFSGSKGNYSDTDIPDPLDDYGLSKYLGEIAGDNCLTLRTSIIGKEIKTQYGLLEWFLKNPNESVEGYKNAIWSGLTTIEIAKLMIKIIEKVYTSDINGIKHLSSSPINKYDLLYLIKRFFDKEIEIKENSKVRIDRSLIISDSILKITGNIKSHEMMIKELSLFDYTKN